MKREDQEFLSGLMDGEWQSLDVRRAIVDVCADDALREKWSRYHLARHAMQHESVVPGGVLAERIARAVADEPTYSNVTAIGTFAAGANAASADATGADAAGGSRANHDDGAAGDRGAATAEAGSVAHHGAPGPSSTGAPPARRAATARTFAAGFGLAASVAAVTALGLNALRDGDVPGSAEVRVAEASAPTTTLVTASGVGGSAASPVDPFAGLAPGTTLPAVELVANIAPSGAYWTTPDSSLRRTDSEARLNMFLSQHIENSPTAERQGMLPYSRLVGYDERVAVGR